MCAEGVWVKSKVIGSKRSCRGAKSSDNIVRCDTSDCVGKMVHKNIDGRGIGAAWVRADALYQTCPAFDWAQYFIWAAGPLCDGVILNIVLLQDEGDGDCVGVDKERVSVIEEATAFVELDGSEFDDSCLAFSGDFAVLAGPTCEEETAAYEVCDVFVFFRDGSFDESLQDSCGDHFLLLWFWVEFLVSSDLLL